MTRRNIIMSAIYQIWHFFFNQRFITRGSVADRTKSGTAQPTWCLPLIIYSLGEVITVPLAQILTSGMITFWFIF